MAQKQDIEALLTKSRLPFESRPFHSPAADSFSYYFESVEHVPERIDCWLTVYRTIDDRRLVGFRLDSFRLLLSKFDELHLAGLVRPDPQTLDLKVAVTALLHLAPDPLKARSVYQEVMQRVLRDASDDGVRLALEPA